MYDYFSKIPPLLFLPQICFGNLFPIFYDVFSQFVPALQMLQVLCSSVSAMYTYVVFLSDGRPGEDVKLSVNLVSNFFFFRLVSSIFQENSFKIYLLFLARKYS
jgi:hypothetical protein